MEVELPVLTLPVQALVEDPQPGFAWGSVRQADSQVQPGPLVGVDILTRSLGDSLVHESSSSTALHGYFHMLPSSRIMADGRTSIFAKRHALGPHQEQLGE